MNQMNRINQMVLALCAGLGITAAALPAAFHPSVRIVYNPSASAPLGWYWVQATASPRVGDYVLATLPADAAALAAQRGYLPAGLPILKRIGAVSGQQVCWHEDVLAADGTALGHVLRNDRQDRSLPAWRQCRRLVNGELFLFSTSHPASFDSRYFGPIVVSDVLGQAVPLWTWSAP